MELNINLKKITISIIGLGYVGLPLANALSKKFKIIGYDINKKRISDLKKGIDYNNDIEIKKNSNIVFTNNANDLYHSKIFIITVPTPIYKNKLPNLEFIRKATLTVSKLLKKNDIIIYESTVYPGCTENYCATLIEKKTSLKLNKDFYLGYSPERINPGDRLHSIDKIQKVVSASDPKVVPIISKLYKSITSKGIFVAKNIQVAEAAKIIENVQRDVNIALINELMRIFRKKNLNIFDILDAAKTKWNFLNFEPGLVGGHCIGIDPYYLTYFARKNNIKTQLVSAGRKINDNIHIFYYKRILNECIKKKLDFSKLKVLLMGYTFKNNCSDVRNTRIKHLFEKIYSNNKNVDIFDPLAYVNDLSTKKHFVNKIKKNYYRIVIIAVNHDNFRKYLTSYNYFSDDTIFFDIKNVMKEKIFKYIVYP